MKKKEKEKKTSSEQSLAGSSDKDAGSNLQNLSPPSLGDPFREPDLEELTIPPYDPGEEIRSTSPLDGTFETYRLSLEIRSTNPEIGAMLPPRLQEVLAETRREYAHLDLAHQINLQTRSPPTVSHRDVAGDDARPNPRTGMSRQELERLDTKSDRTFHESTEPDSSKNTTESKEPDSSKNTTESTQRSVKKKKEKRKGCVVS